MEITAAGVYWFVKCDALVAFFGVMAFLCASLDVFLWTCYSENYLNKKVPIILAFTAVLFLLTSLMMPTTKQAAMIFIAPKVLNSDVLRKDIPEEAKELYGLAKTWLQDKAKKEGSN